MDILVIGAGIGGLSAANALARAGHQVTVLERAAGFDAVGAGIILGPNAVRVLEVIGVDLAGEGRTLSSIDVCDSAGRLLSRVDHGGLPRSFGPTLGIARSRLHALLARALPENVEIVLGHAADTVLERPDDVRVRWAGQRRTVDLVVGADGLRSTVRSQTVGSAIGLRYSGQTCWRGIGDLDPGDTAVEAWGGRSRVGVVPLGDRRSYYYLVRAARPDTPGPGDVAGLRALMGDFDGVAGDVLAALDTVPDLHHDLFELDRPVWGTPRVLLLGDAAHGMTPNQGQGAAMAIEDAQALALAFRPGVSGAQDRYRDLRHRRVRRVQLNSRRIGSVAHWQNPVATRLRDLAMRSTPRAAEVRALRSLVGPGIELATRTGTNA